MTNKPEIYHINTTASDPTAPSHHKRFMSIEPARLVHAVYHGEPGNKGVREIATTFHLQPPWMGHTPDTRSTPPVATPNATSINGHATQRLVVVTQDSAQPGLSQSLKQDYMSVSLTSYETGLLMQWLQRQGATQPQHSARTVPPELPDSPAPHTVASTPRSRQDDDPERDPSNIDHLTKGTP